MDETQIYALVLGGLFASLVVARLLSWLYQDFLRYKTWLLRLLVYPYLMRRHRLAGPWTRAQVIGYLLYLIANIFSASFRVSSITAAESRTGILSLVNVVPLFFGLHLGFLADLLGISLRTYHWIHSAAASMSMALATTHVILHAVIHGSVSLRARTQLYGVIAATSLLVLFAARIKIVRRPSYELFLRSHQIIAALYAITIWRHVGSRSRSRISLLCIQIIPGVFLSTVLLETAAIIIRNFALRQPYARALIYKKGKAVSLSLSVPRPWNIRAGQYINLWIPVDGKLKPDTFAEERLLGQPPGVCVMLVMYSRFHNFAAENIAAINEDGRFTMPKEGEADYDAKLKKRDNDIFQTARLIVGGMYINISLHDYIRGITNVHHSDSTWTLDPRIEVAGTSSTPAVERGVGNMVSAEFNLLYRFHPAISDRDNKWTDEFFRGIYGDKEPEKIGLKEFYEGVAKYEAGIAKEPSERTFGGLTRDSKTGKFDDAGLVKILRESMEDPAGTFGANKIPKHLRTVEILGILQARRWQVASLNEFRQFFGLKRHDSFESINPDPVVADLLRKLYDSPDMVELYPGLFVEDAKPRRDPGSGFNAPYTVGRAVLSDAVTLVRGDRFYTLDYTVSTLTKWGMAEVQQNYETLGGSMLYRLIHRAVPKWFKFNSIYVMQPMYLPSMNEEIAKEFNTFDLYCRDPPGPPPKTTVLSTHAAISALLNDQANFKVKYGIQLPDLVFPEYMLQGDGAANRENHAFVVPRIMKVSGGMDTYAKAFEAMTRKILAREAYKLGDRFQVDITKDVARVVTVLTHADFLNLSLDNDSRNDEGLSEEDMYKCIVNYLNYANIDSDPAESWNLRREAHKSFARLKTSTEHAVKKTGAAGGVIGKFFAAAPPAQGSLKEIGLNLTKDLLGAGYSVEKTATTLFTTAAGGIANIPSMFVQILDWFLREENAEHWAAVKDLAAKNDAQSFETVKKYVLEAGRLTSFLALVRICVPAQGQEAQIKNDQGQRVAAQKGEVVLSNVTAAFRDPAVFPDPDQVKLDRPTETYQMWSMGPHGCAGRAVAITALASMTKVCAQLKNLRRAPGAQGQLKYVPGPLGSRKYLSDDWSRYQPFAGTWKVHFDDFHS